MISDRKKDVIITGGENVSSIEVEDCLYQHPAVAEVAVIGVPDEKWGETVKALVVVRDGSTATEDELIAHCRARLAHFKAPTSVELRDALDRTATGKLQKYKLRQPYWEGRDKLVELVGGPHAGPPTVRLERSSMTRCPRSSKAAATSPAMSRRSGSPTMARRQPVSSRLGSPQSSCAMSARVASRPWSKSRSSAIWRTTPEQTATAAGGAWRVPALRGHPDLLRREGEAALDGLEDLGRPPWARWRPSTPRVPRSSSLLRGGRCVIASSPRSERTMRRGRLFSAARALAPRRHLLRDGS